MNNTVSIGLDGALYQLIFFNIVPSIFARSHHGPLPDSKPGSSSKTSGDLMQGKVVEQQTSQPGRPTEEHEVN